MTPPKALPKQEGVVVRIARDMAFTRDILDLAVIADRHRESSRTFRKYLSEKSARWPEYVNAAVYPAYPAE